jgi:hypothetical protein
VRADQIPGNLVRQHLIPTPGRGAANNRGTLQIFTSGATTLGIPTATPTSFENGNFPAEKGSAANDVRHRAVISFVWSPTFTKSTGAVARYLVNDWQLSQVTTLQSAQLMGLNQVQRLQEDVGLLNASKLELSSQLSAAVAEKRVRCK